MLNFSLFDNDPKGKKREEPYPDFFRIWNDAVNKGVSPGYSDPENLCEIIEIYLSEDEVDKTRFTINYALKLYPDNEDLIYDIMLLLNDYELWNDLLTLCQKYNHIDEIWIDGHTLTALLHLGMEEDAFHLFRKAKEKSLDNSDDLTDIYQFMVEALYDVDLFDAAIEVVEEAISLIGDDIIDLKWLQLHCYLSLEDKESVITIGEEIQKLNPLDVDIWSRLGNIYKEIGDMGKAIEAFEFAVSLGVKDSHILINMIHSYDKNGNPIKAIEKAEEYLAMYPDSYLVSLMAAKICSQIELWEKALKFIEKSIVLEPLIESLYLYKCNFLLKLGEHKKAIIALEAGIKKTKDTKGDLQKQLNSLKKQFPEF